MFERLSGDYNRGYTQAIQDIAEIFEYIDSALLYHHKRLNMKLARKLLKTILIHREKIRDRWNGFIRWNAQTEDFEYYSKGDSNVLG